MNAAIDSDLFRREFGGWAIRGICCAAVSAFWAVMIGFEHPAEIAGMIAGVAGWVAVFAAACLWLPLPPAFSRPRTVRALKVAAWIKFALAMLGALAAFGTSNLCGPLRVLGMLGLVDVAFGMAALWCASQLAGAGDVQHLATFDSFGWTALTTVLEGALMALMIGAIAVAVLGWWRLVALVQKQNLPPAHVAG